MPRRWRDKEVRTTENATGGLKAILRGIWQQWKDNREQQKIGVADCS